MSIKEKISGKVYWKKVIKYVIMAVVVVAAVFLIKGLIAKKNNAGDGKEQENQTVLVTRGNVSTTITGSGSLEPYERYEVIPLVNGEIMSSPFEVGDFVEEGAVIYEFDKTDAEINLNKQRNSMQRSTITYTESLDQKDNLYIKAPCSGVVQTINVNVGDEIGAGKEITKIINTQILTVKLPFNKTQVEKIVEGDGANLTSSAAMSNISGIVTNVAATPQAEADGASLYYVTIEFTNPGSVSEGDSFGGSVNGIVSPGAGTAQYKEQGQVNSSIAGTVASINYKEGDYVSKDEVLVRLTSDSVDNSLEKSKIDYDDAKLNLENQENQIEDYSLTSPISGTVLVKNSKAGDTIDKTNASVTMMIIGDVSKLKFTLSIDELDVAKVSVGQQVNITADAVAGKTFIGEITNIAMEGTATNGVTTYEAEVTIFDPQELKPSMNVDAVVVVESVENVLRVPSSEIVTSMGRSYVYVKDDGSVKQEQKGNKIPQEERPQGDMPERPAKAPEAPEGFVTVEVKIGVRGDDYTEIISGLSEGQQIYQKQVSSSGGSNMNFGMGGGMSGGMGGGMPGSMGGGMSGGMGGGARGGMGR